MWWSENDGMRLTACTVQEVLPVGTYCMTGYYVISDVCFLFDVLVTSCFQLQVWTWDASFARAVEGHNRSLYCDFFFLVESLNNRSRDIRRLAHATTPNVIVLLVPKRGKRPCSQQPSLKIINCVNFAEKARERGWKSMANASQQAMLARSYGKTHSGTRNADRFQPVRQCYCRSYGSSPS